MRLKYDPEYWHNYYDGPYKDTFHYAFPLENILISAWADVFPEALPQSFADIGSGPGHTLQVAEELLPGATLYGIEAQPLPSSDIVHQGVILGDFMEMSHTLKPVDFLYCSCSMYLSWTEQPDFLKEVLRLSKKAVCFANVYLSDKQGIPHDSQRKVIYSNPKAFATEIEGFGGWKRSPGPYDFFYKTSP